MIEVEYNRSLIGQSLDAKLRRMRDLRVADADAQRTVLRANRGIAFKAVHPLSHLVAKDGRVEIGSRAPGYFKLLQLPSERLATIYADWIVNGRARGA